MPYRPVNAIEVLYVGRKVGAIALDPGSGYYAFEYYPEFKQAGVELAPLTLPLATTNIAIFPNLSERTYHRLPPFIADSLPDNFGNSLIDAWMAKNQIDPASFSPLDRLAYVGKRGMGALEYRPAIRRGGALKATAIELNELVSAARKAVTVDLKRVRPEDVDEGLAQLIEVGTSAGGARAKAVVGWNPRSETFVSGQFNIPDGYEHWIIKFDTTEPVSGDSGQFGRIEYAYYLMACAAGIDISASRLYETGGRAHFMTKRFDRGDGNAKFHVQTLCALRGMDFNLLHVHDYAQLFATAAELKLPYEAFDEICRRMVFNVAFSNNDDHTKNHAFLLKQGNAWDLAPAYDMTHARNSAQNAWTKVHNMGVGGVFSDILREDILKLCAHYPIKNPEQIIDSILDIAYSWPEFARQAGLSPARTDQVAEDIAACSALLKKRTA